MKRGEDDDGVELFLLKKRKEVETKVGAKNEEAQRIKDAAERRALAHQAEMLERDRRMREHEESAELLMKQLLRIEEEKERLLIRQHQLLAAERLVTPAAASPAPCHGTPETTSVFTAPAAHEVTDKMEHQGTFWGQDSLLGGFEDGSRERVKREWYEDDNSPWLSTSGGDSLAEFDKWRQQQQQQQHKAESPGSIKPPGHSEAVDVIVISSDSDSDSDEEDRKFSNTGSWKHKIIEDAGLTSPGDTLISSKVCGRVEYASHDPGSCSASETPSGSGTPCSSVVARHIDDDIHTVVSEAGGEGQSADKNVEEHWSSAWPGLRTPDQQQLVKRVARTKLKGRCMVNYHKRRERVFGKVRKALEEVSPSAFATEDEYRAFKIQKAQKIMSDWEFNYINNQLSRGTASLPKADTSSEAEATSPVPAVGQRLEIWTKDDWCVGDVIHYCYSDGEHTVLFEGEKVKSIRLTKQIVRELTT